MIKKAELYLGIGSDVLIELMDYYNKNCVQYVKPTRKYNIKLGDNWCAMFVSVIAHMKGVENFPYEVSCMEQIKLLKDQGIFTKNYKQAKAGDLIYFDWQHDRWSDHVGIVTFIDGEYIYTIEGNRKNTVSTRKIGIHSKSLYGFGLMDKL